MIQPIPADMLVMHNPPNSLGDCMRASLATLLGRASADVPHLAHEDDWIGAINAWLRPQGLGLVCARLPFQGVRIADGTFGLIFGLSERGVPHAIVGRVELRGDFVHLFPWHDPHPSRAGLADGSADTFVFLVPVPRSV